MSSLWEISNGNQIHSPHVQIKTRNRHHQCWRRQNFPSIYFFRFLQAQSNFLPSTHAARDHLAEIDPSFTRAQLVQTSLEKANHVHGGIGDMKEKRLCVGKWEGGGFEGMGGKRLRGGKWEGGWFEDMGGKRLRGRKKDRKTIMFFCSQHLYDLMNRRKFWAFSVIKRMNDSAVSGSE